MFVRTYAGAIVGIDAAAVTVEVNIAGGGLGMYLVGLPVYDTFLLIMGGTQFAAQRAGYLCARNLGESRAYHYRHEPLLL